MKMMIDKRTKVCRSFYGTKIRNEWDETYFHAVVVIFIRDNWRQCVTGVCFKGKRGRFLGQGRFLSVFSETISTQHANSFEIVKILSQVF